MLGLIHTMNTVGVRKHTTTLTVSEEDATPKGFGVMSSLLGLNSSGKKTKSASPTRNDSNLHDDALQTMRALDFSDRTILDRSTQTDTYDDSENTTSFNTLLPVDHTVAGCEEHLSDKASQTVLSSMMNESDVNVELFRDELAAAEHLSGISSVSMHSRTNSIDGATVITQTCNALNQTAAPHAAQASDEQENTCSGVNSSFDQTSMPSISSRVEPSGSDVTPVASNNVMVYYLVAGTVCVAVSSIIYRVTQKNKTQKGLQILPKTNVRA